MIFTQQPAIVPPDLSPLRESLPISRPIDPEIARQSFLNSSLDSFEIKTANATYKVNLVKDWAERTPSEPTPKIHYSKVATQETVVLTQKGNTCGPTSLAMVLQSMGIDASVEAVKSQTFCSERIGTSPLDIQAAARRYGLHAAIRTDSSLNAVMNLIDSNARCIALIEQSGALHYVVISGYRKTPEGKMDLLISDPNGFQRYESSKDFNTSWENPTLRGFSVGLNKLLIVVSKDDVVADNFSGYGRFLSGAHSFANTCAANIPSILTPFVLALSFFSFKGRKDTAKAISRTAFRLHDRENAKKVAKSLISQT